MRICPMTWATVRMQTMVHHASLKASLKRSFAKRELVFELSCQLGFSP